MIFRPSWPSAKAGARSVLRRLFKLEQEFHPARLRFPAFPHMAKSMLLTFQPMSASSMWNISEAEFPANGSPRQKLGFAVKYAALAPTGLNWQPWEFWLADTHLELTANDDLALETVDPDGRELMIGCGAALLYLRRALKHFGCL